MLSKKDLFVVRARSVHGERYNYDGVVYVNNRTLVGIHCHEHGEFRQIPNGHLSGRGCPRCGGRMKLTTKEFIDAAKVIHRDLYVKVHSPVKIICSKHGVFEQRPTNHLSGGGCLTCKSSKGELAIARILRKHTMAFTQEYSIPGQRRNFKYDFHVPFLNLLIEFHGIQHYQPVPFFGGEEGFASIKIRDAVKKTLAKFCGYRFIEINYTQFLNLSEEGFEKKLLMNLNRFRN